MRCAARAASGADALRKHGNVPRQPADGSRCRSRPLQGRIALHGQYLTLSLRAGLGHVLQLDVYRRRGIVKQMFLASTGIVSGDQHRAPL